MAETSVTTAADSRVRAAFSRAAGAYDRVAEFQRAAGEALLQGLMPTETAPDRLLDLGCGTGHGLGLLARHFPDAQRLALDFALPMVSGLTPSPGQMAICADAHHLPLLAGSVDMVWSSLALQWCQPARVLAEMARVLRPGGDLALATLGPETFQELRQAFLAVDDHQHTLTFSPPETLQSLVLSCGFQSLRFERRRMSFYYPDLPRLFAVIRELGANQLGQAGQGKRRSGMMGKQAWQRFQAAYESQRTAAGLPLSYDTLFIYARKK